MIEEYKFGFIIIDGQEYDHDVQVFPSAEVKSWWRKTSHEVISDDIREALEQRPKIIIFGTGSPGMMEVSEEAKEEIISRRIEFIIEPTARAIEKFNEAKKTGKEIVGLFHLTC